MVDVLDAWLFAAWFWSMQRGDGLALGAQRGVLAHAASAPWACIVKSSGFSPQDCA